MLFRSSGNSTTQSFGAAPDNWNTRHFLDVGEFTAAFAIAYDWMFDAWTETQRDAIRWSIINLGLRYGVMAYDGTGSRYGWWTSVNGNWNCVSPGIVPYSERWLTLRSAGLQQWSHSRSSRNRQRGHHRNRSANPRLHGSQRRRQLRHGTLERWNLERDRSEEHTSEFQSQ